MDGSAHLYNLAPIIACHVKFPVQPSFSPGILLQDDNLWNRSLDHDGNYASNNPDYEAHVHVNEDCSEEGDHPDKSIPPRSIPVFLKVRHLQDDSFEASEDDGSEDADWEGFKDGSNPEEDKKKEDGGGEGCEEALSAAVLLHKAASKGTGHWEAAEKASKNVGSTLSNKLLVGVYGVTMLGTKHGTQALSDDIRNNGNGDRFHEHLRNERRTGEGWLRETCWNAADVTDGFDLMDRVEVKRGGDDDANDNEDQLGWNREPALRLDLGRHKNADNKKESNTDYRHSEGYHISRTNVLDNIDPNLDKPASSNVIVHLNTENMFDLRGEGMHRGTNGEGADEDISEDSGNAAESDHTHHKLDDSNTESNCSGDF